MDHQPSSSPTTPAAAAPPPFHGAADGGAASSPSPCWSRSLGLAWYLTHRAPATVPGGGPGPPGAGAGGAARGAAPGARGAPPSTVGVAPARHADIPVIIEALGTVTPVAIATVTPQVSGVLTQVLYQEGQMVQKGQVLATIDPKPFQAALAQANAARLRDVAQLDAARVQLERYQVLLKQDSIARQTVDTQDALVKQLTGTVALDRANEDTARLNLQWSRIVAPIAGRVGLRPIDAGNYIASGNATGVATITQISPIDVQFSIPQELVPEVKARIAAGAQLPVTAWDSGRTRQLDDGEFLTLDNQIDVQTGTIKAKARFANAGGALFPNQFVNVRLLLQTIDGAVVGSGHRAAARSERRFRLRRQCRPYRVAAQRQGRHLGRRRCRDHRRPGIRRAGRHRRRRSVEGRRTNSDQRGSARGYGSGYGCNSDSRCGSRHPQRPPRCRGPGRCAYNAVSPSRPFIERPVATSLLMLAIVLAGLVGFRFLPLSALPQVDYPTIQVQTLYPGASPEVMGNTVTAPLEGQFGQMSGLDRMSSTSAAGVSVITLQFSLNLSLDVAEQEVQAAINASGSLLPADLPAPPVYAKVNPADAPVLTLAVSSDSMPLPDVQNLVNTRLAQKISQVTGVGLVSLSGGQRPAVRIQANTQALASYGIGLDTLRTAISNANSNAAKGNFDGPKRAYSINSNDQLLTADDYRGLIVAYRNGAPVRISNVADVVESAENNQLGAWAGLPCAPRAAKPAATADRSGSECRGNEGAALIPAIIMNVQRQPGANVIATVDAIKAQLPALQAGLPASVTVDVLADRTSGIRASVNDVEKELLLAVVLVVLVIFAFLGSPRATVIASIAVPISLIGTFGLMYLLGYSLNNLSLMALTIATGFVVDDAIVMIENISRYIEHGEPPMRAALTGATQIGFTIISLTISLIAVLIPLLFMSDVVGRLFREFAVTLAITILISAVVSLTLVPMMSARWLKTRRDEGAAGAVASRGQRFFAAVLNRYDHSLVWVIDHQRLTLLVALATFAITVLLYVTIPKGLFPTQDTGQLQARVQAAQDVSYDRMADLQAQAAQAILADPAVQNLSSIVGVDAANNTMLQTGSMLINLVSSHGDQQVVMNRLRDRVRTVPGVTLYLQPTQDLTIDAETGPTEYRASLEGVDNAQITKWMGLLIARLQDAPEVRNVSSDAGVQGMTSNIDVDRDTASRLGITASAGRRRALQRVRPAHRLDDLHRNQSVPRDSRGCTRTGDECRRRRQAEPDLQQRAADAAVRVREDHRAACAAADHARRPVSGKHAQLRHRAGCRARPRGRRGAQGRAGHRTAVDDHAELSRRFGGLRAVAGQRALADPGRGGVRLHRARRALRKLTCTR